MNFTNINRFVFLSFTRNISEKSFVHAVKDLSKAQRHVLNKQQTKRNREKRYGLSQKILQLTNTNQIERAIKLFGLLTEHEKRIKPSIVLVNTLLTACKNARKFSWCWEIFKKWIIGYDVLSSLSSSQRNNHAIFSPDEVTIVVMLDAMVDSFESGTNMFGKDCENGQELRSIYKEHMNIIKEVWLDSNRNGNVITTGIMNNILRLVGRIGDDYNDILTLVSNPDNKDTITINDPDMITFHTIMQGLVYLNAPIPVLQHYFTISCGYKFIDIHLVNRLLLGLVKQSRHEPNTAIRSSLLGKTKRLLHLCYQPRDFIEGFTLSSIYKKLFENIVIPRIGSMTGKDIVSEWFVPNEDISKWNIKPNEMTHSLVLQAIRIVSIKKLYNAYSDMFQCDKNGT